MVATHIIHLKTGPPDIDPCILLAILYGVDALVGDLLFVGRFHPSLVQWLSAFPCSPGADPSGTPAAIHGMLDLLQLAINSHQPINKASLKASSAPQLHEMKRSLYIHALFDLPTARSGWQDIPILSFAFREGFNVALTPSLRFAEVRCQWSLSVQLGVTLTPLNLAVFNRHRETRPRHSV